MLSDYPVLFDGEEIMQWSKWEESSDTVENMYETEAGIDQINVIRYDKLTIDVEYQCHSEWLQRFTHFSKADQITVSMYDPDLDGYKDRTMRIRNFKKKAIEFSEKVSGTEGVWKVTFTLEEF